MYIYICICIYIYIWNFEGINVEYMRNLLILGEDMGTCFIFIKSIELKRWNVLLSEHPVLGAFNTPSQDQVR